MKLIPLGTRVHNFALGDDLIDGMVVNRMEFLFGEPKYAVQPFTNESEVVCEPIVFLHSDIDIVPFKKQEKEVKS